MTDPQLQLTLSRLFRNTEKAHQEARGGSGRDDPDWSIWYADQLAGPLEQQAGMKFDRSQLIFSLMNAELEHVARAPDSDWAEFYANEFIQHFAASDSAADDRLALYFMPSCPFCWNVLDVIKRLGLQVEMRDVTADRARRDELMEARGRPTVPVLRIYSPGGEERWMPESQDIVHYLQSTYG
ncbi:MAG: glutaredoxin [Gammaproteobacteria bacterium]|nr:glutaredoxin [Gammaproteobacteria bacterium]